MRILIGIALLVWSFLLLIYIVNLLSCGCAHVTPLHFAGIGLSIVAGFAVMLKEE